VGYSVAVVDAFIDHLVAKGRGTFTAALFTAWHNRHYSWQATVSQGSQMLQMHRGNPQTRRHHIGCTRHGPAAPWYVAGSADARRMLTRVCQEKAAAVRKELAYRVNPTAALNPATLAAMRPIESAIAGLMTVLVDLAAPNGNTP
jgi:hypothetical protein